MSDQPAAPAPGTPAAPAPGAAPAAAPAAPAPGEAPAAPAAPAAFTPAIAPWSGDKVYTLGEAGKEQPWWNTITEEPVRQLMETKQYKNPAEVAVAYHNANKLVNLQPAVQAVLSGNATPEQETAFYNAMGRPESPDKYDLKVPEGIATNDDIQKLGKEIFFEAGLSPKKAEALFNKWNEGVKTMQQAGAAAERQQNDADLTALQTKWGDKLEANKAAGNRAVKALGIDAALIEKIENNIGSAAIVELLAAIGNKAPEGEFKAGGTSTDPNDPATMSPATAKAKIAELQADTVFMAKYQDPNNAGNKEAVSLMERLFAKAG